MEWWSSRGRRGVSGGVVAVVVGAYECSSGPRVQGLFGWCRGVDVGNRNISIKWVARNSMKYDDEDSSSDRPS